MYDHIIRAVFDSPWAIQPSKLEAIVQVIENKLLGIEARDFEAAASRPRAMKRGKVAILPVYGVISKRMNLMSEISGGTSTDLLSADLNALVEDESVKAIVMDMDTPGGSVFGIQETAAIMRAAREKKHITAMVNPLSASAGYWLASQASEVVMTPSGEVGSVGVVTAHKDESAADEQNGIKVTYISAGKHKVGGNPHEAIDEETLSVIQGKVDTYYDAFTKDIAAGRGISQDTVLSGYGEGGTVLAKAALAEGMVDRIATLDEVINKLGASRPNHRANKVRMI